MHVRHGATQVHTVSPMQSCAPDHAPGHACMHVRRGAVSAGAATASDSGCASAWGITGSSPVGRIEPAEESTGPKHTERQQADQGHCCIQPQGNCDSGCVDWHGCKCSCVWLLGPPVVVAIGRRLHGACGSASGGALAPWPLLPSALLWYPSMTVHRRAAVRAGGCALGGVHGPQCHDHPSSFKRRRPLPTFSPCLRPPPCCQDTESQRKHYAAGDREGQRRVR